MSETLRGRHFLRISDFSPQELEQLLELSARVKAVRRARRERPLLTGRQIALIFEKGSTRTRCAFEVAARDQGAATTYIGETGSHLGAKESIRDTARVLGRLYDGIEYRGYEERRVDELAAAAGVPVWNGLTNESHPTQALADLLTIREDAGRPFPELRLCYVGDAHNNTAASLLVAAAKMGMDMRVAAPRACWPSRRTMSVARAAGESRGARLLVTEDPDEALRGADYVYTDVWVSLGEPEAIWEERITLLRPYQVNAALLERTGKPEVRFMHCLPAFHDIETEVGRDIWERFGLEAMEVTNDVFESPASIVFDQAENRMHTIKAILIATLLDPPHEVELGTPAGGAEGTGTERDRVRLHPGAAAG